MRAAGIFLIAIAVVFAGLWLAEIHHRGLEVVPVVAAAMAVFALLSAAALAAVLR